MEKGSFFLQNVTAALLKITTMKNFKFLVFAIIALSIAACEETGDYSFQGARFDAGPLTIPAHHTKCELVPQYTFAKDDAFEIMIKCEEPTNY